MENGVGVQKFNRNGVLGKQDKGIPVAASFDLVSALKGLTVVFRQGAQQWWVRKRIGEWKGNGPVASKVWRLGWEFSHEGTKTPRLCGCTKCLSLCSARLRRGPRFGKRGYGVSGGAMAAANGGSFKDGFIGGANGFGAGLVFAGL